MAGTKPAPDRHGALVEAVAVVGVWRMRSLVELTVSEATLSLRRQITPSAMGWANAEWHGSTRQRGFELKRCSDAPSVLVTWREIATAIRVAWRPEFTELHDAAFAARYKLHAACVSPVEWPAGVDHYVGLERRIHAVDDWIRGEVLAAVSSFEQLALL